MENLFSKPPQIAMREALHIYSNCLTGWKRDEEPISLKDSYRLDLHGLKNHAINMVLKIEIPGDNESKWSENFERNFKKYIGIAKLDLIEQKKIQWIYNLKRYELLFLNTTIDIKIREKQSDPHSSMNGDFNIATKIYNIENILNILSPIEESDESDFLRYRLLFLVDNCLYATKIDRSLSLENYNKELYIFNKTIPWFNKKIDAFGERFTEWAQKYFRDVQPPIPIQTLRDSQSYPPSTYPTEPHRNWPILHHDFDFHRVKFTQNYSLITADSELYLIKMKAAWSQKVYRDSNNDRKGCSFQLQTRHVALLDKLCKHNRRRKNEMIEILIEDACEDAGIIKKPNRR